MTGSPMRFGVFMVSAAMAVGCSAGVKNWQDAGFIVSAFVLVSIAALAALWQEYEEED